MTSIAVSALLLALSLSLLVIQYREGTKARRVARGIIKEHMGLPYKKLMSYCGMCSNLWCEVLILPCTTGKRIVVLVFKNEREVVCESVCRVPELRRRVRNNEQDSSINKSS